MNSCDSQNKIDNEQIDAVEKDDIYVFRNICKWSNVRASIEPVEGYTP